ncbi:MAG: hypothetical protein EXS15_00545 [Phycisphaerales bacterium]|nr:hypothetical protein [Phycisphaerales bacterium]
MKWIVAVPLLLAVLVADISFMPAFEIGSVHPKLTLILVAFVAMHAPLEELNWFALLAGLMMDLSNPSFFGPHAPFYLIGPSAIGLFFAVQLLVAVRGFLVRRNPIAVAAMAGALTVASGLMWTAWWALRSWYPDSPPPWGDGSALLELGSQFAQALSTAVMALPIGWLLIRTHSWWNFPSTLPRRIKSETTRIIRQ